MSSLCLAPSLQPSVFEIDFLCCVHRISLPLLFFFLLLLSITPLYGCAIDYLSILLLMDILVVSGLGSLKVEL